jgi:hypothetical protein
LTLLWLLPLARAFVNHCTPYRYGGTWPDRPLEWVQLGLSTCAGKLLTSGGLQNSIWKELYRSSLEQAEYLIIFSLDHFLLTHEISFCLFMRAATRAFARSAALYSSLHIFRRGAFTGTRRLSTQLVARLQSPSPTYPQIRIATMASNSAITLTNRCGESKSPYVRSHMDNPTAWQLWTPETLELAQKTNRVMFVSIGYSACHWCHVRYSQCPYLYR